MTNADLIQRLGYYPKHPVHNIGKGALQNRWLTATCQLPVYHHDDITNYRTIILDRLYRDWQTYRDTIEHQPRLL